MNIRVYLSWLYTCGDFSRVFAYEGTAGSQNMRIFSDIRHCSPKWFYTLTAVSYWTSSPIHLVLSDHLILPVWLMWNAACGFRSHFLDYSWGWVSFHVFFSWPCMFPLVWIAFAHFFPVGVFVLSDLRWPRPAAAWSKISVTQPETEVRPRQWERWILVTRSVASNKALAHRLCRNEFPQRDWK